MTPEFVVNLGSEAIKLALMLSLPLLGIGLIVGLCVAILQATTQIQEMTLTMIPKIIAVLLVLLFVSPWMLEKLSSFTSHLIINITQMIR